MYTSKHEEYFEGQKIYNKQIETYTSKLKTNIYACTKSSQVGNV